ncbi:MAG: hypothetical protein IPN34_13275 [Planctomycetes bacterium]|nr:hypothetical protein [Planctomycetota bacterium]
MQRNFWLQLLLLFGLLHSFTPTLDAQCLCSSSGFGRRGSCMGQNTFPQGGCGMNPLGIATVGFDARPHPQYTTLGMILSFDISPLHWTIYPPGDSCAALNGNCLADGLLDIFFIAPGSSVRFPWLCQVPTIDLQVQTLYLQPSGCIVSSEVLLVTIA